MLKKCAVAMLLALLVATNPSAQDARTAVANASKAMGADSLRSVQYTGSGYDFAFGQAYSPTSPWPKFTVKSYTRSIDFERSASQATRVCMQFENPPRGGGHRLGPRASGSGSGQRGRAEASWRSWIPSGHSRTDSTASPLLWPPRLPQIGGRGCSLGVTHSARTGIRL